MDVTRPNKGKWIEKEDIIKSIIISHYLEVLYIDEKEIVELYVTGWYLISV